MTSYNLRMTLCSTTSKWLCMTSKWLVRNSQFCSMYPTIASALCALFCIVQFPNILHTFYHTFQASIVHFHVRHILQGWTKFRKDVRNIKENIIFNPLLNFVHNFWFEVQNLKWIFGDEFKIDFPTFISLNFLKKVNLLCLNEF